MRWLDSSDIVTVDCSQVAWLRALAGARPWLPRSSACFLRRCVASSSLSVSPLVALSLELLVSATMPLITCGACIQAAELVGAIPATIEPALLLQLAHGVSHRWLVCQWWCWRLLLWWITGPLRLHLLLVPVEVSQPVHRRALSVAWRASTDGALFHQEVGLIALLSAQNLVMHIAVSQMSILLPEVVLGPAIGRLSLL